MNIEEILESGFLKSFIHEYYEYKIYSFYPDKMRLLYLLCNSDDEKTAVTSRQIEICIRNISELGHEDLSSAYLMSCRPEDHLNYLHINERYDFWLRRITEELELYFPDVDLEDEIKGLIQKGIATYNNDDKSWEFDFFDYDGFNSHGKPTGLLFTLPELFVQLELLSEYRSLLEPNILDDNTGKGIVNPEVKIKTDVFDDLITILKDYFDEEYHEELRELLLSKKKLNRKLVFIGSAIQLTDVFKQLFENQMIVGCNKQYLEKWLVNNFMFNKNGNISEFNHQSTHKSISGNNYPCKKPIIQIGNGKLCRF